VLTAICVGMIILFCAVWAYSRLAAVSIPITGYMMPLDRVTGTLSSGAAVDLYKGREKVGAAATDVFLLQDDKKSAAAVFKDVVMLPGKVTLDVDRVRIGDVAAPTFEGTVIDRQPRYLFPRAYLQGGVAGLIVLLGGLFLYRYIGTRPSTVDFLVETDAEMKKVNWSTRQIIVDSTIVVICATFLIAGYIFIADFGFSSFMEFIGILKR